jgi:hypothetical protein
LLYQLEASVQSLRTYNRAIPIIVFFYGNAPAQLERMLQPYGVNIWNQETYEARLARYLPRAWQAMARYPVLHKSLNFRELASLDPDQILALDCDTLFAGDVAELFERYASADCCAREEPTCSRSHYGYDPQYVDEAALANIAAAEGLRIPPPFNLGVVLWNHKVWNRFPRLDEMIVHYAWRFLIWMARNPAAQDNRATAYGESEAALILAEHFDRLATADDLHAALPFPSANRWILEQMALWFALGHIPGLRYADFSPSHVLQNGEFDSPWADRANWILCHYFSQNLERISVWLGDRAARSRAAEGMTVGT